MLRIELYLPYGQKHLSSSSTRPFERVETQRRFITRGSVRFNYEDNGRFHSGSYLIVYNFLFS
jgi:hypothetical protein